MHASILGNVLAVSIVSPGVVPIKMFVTESMPDVCFVFTNEDYVRLKEGAPILVPESSPEGVALKTLNADQIHLIPESAIAKVDNAES